jgi:hypothetical protein
LKAELVLPLAVTATPTFAAADAAGSTLLKENPLFFKKHLKLSTRISIALTLLPTPRRSCSKPAAAVTETFNSFQNTKNHEALPLSAHPRHP